MHWSSLITFSACGDVISISTSRGLNGSADGTKGKVLKVFGDILPNPGKFVSGNIDGLNVFAAGRVDVTEAGRVDVTMAAGIVYVATAGRVDVTMAGRVDVTMAGRVDVTMAGRVDVTMAGRVDVTMAGRVDVTRAVELTTAAMVEFNVVGVVEIVATGRVVTGVGRLAVTVVEPCSMLETAEVVIVAEEIKDVGVTNNIEPAFQMTII